MTSDLPTLVLSKQNIIGILKGQISEGMAGLLSRKGSVCHRARHRLCNLLCCYNSRPAGKLGFRTETSAVWIDKVDKEILIAVLAWFSGKAAASPVKQCSECQMGGDKKSSKKRCGNEESYQPPAQSIL